MKNPLIVLALHIAMAALVGLAFADLINMVLGAASQLLVGLRV
jgi:hypothetical protein